MRWTITQAAREWGIDKATLKKRMAELAIEIKRNARYHTRLITRAIVGDLESEKILETRERRKALEMDNAERERRLVPLEEAAKMVNEAHLPVRQWILSLPANAASRCNPADPQLARDALQRIIDDAFPTIRAALDQSARVEPDRLKYG